MLQSLELENFLLFEKASFEFSLGLNAVSGETGAGKSLLAKALGLALGGRGGQDAIRSGAVEARVRAVFQIDPAKWADTAGRLADASGTVAIERVIRRDGSEFSVNNQVLTAQAVRQALAPLVDFAAQNEQVRLACPSYQLELLDAHAKLGGQAEEYRGLYRVAESLAKRLRAGGEERELVRLRLERLRGELRELEQLAFDPETDSRLEDEIREMSHAAAIVQAAAEAMQLLETGEPPALEALGRAGRTLERMAGVSDRLAEAGRDFFDLLERAEGVRLRLAAVSEEMDADPARIDAMIGRSEKLKAMAKRLDCRVEELAATRTRLEAEIGDLSEWDAGEEEIRRKLAALFPGLTAAGRALSDRRREGAGRLTRFVNRELAGLGMEQAGFEAALESLWREGMPPERILELGPSGFDEVNFCLSPNPGEAASPLAGAVSGGEASRAMLAIKAALSEVYRPDLMFLDEVDAGVGARLGRELGDKLRGLALTRQVVIITHLPQIAACAATHLKVAKKVRGGRTTARVERLEGEARLREIASMIHGSSAGRATLTQAREMLVEGGNAVI
ncbi:MAG: AAA family ATPase [Planctomycetes bacterium]|nr:AAA family ATPase [Planctomycetota bacterium]